MTGPRSPWPCAGWPGWPCARIWTGRGLCEEALGTVQDTDDQTGRANALHVLGVAAQMRGDLRQAGDLMTRRIETARELSDFAAVGAESSNLSMVERQLGNLARAEQLAREALQIRSDGATNG